MLLAFGFLFHLLPNLLYDKLKKKPTHNHSPEFLRDGLTIFLHSLAHNDQNIFPNMPVLLFFPATVLPVPEVFG